MSAKPIGQSMIEAKLLNERQLSEVLAYQKRSPERVPVGRLAVELGIVEEDKFAPFLASYFDVPYLNLQGGIIAQKEALDTVPEPTARRFNVLPIIKQEDTLTVAVSDPLDLTTLENLQTVTRCRIKAVVSPAGQIRDSIIEHYATGLKEHHYRVSVEAQPAQRQPRASASSLIQLLIERALNNDVDLIHIEPDENRVKMLFRVGKKLEKIASYPKDTLSSIADFIKRESRLSLKTRQIPQSGYFTFGAGISSIEVGVSIFPTVSGERIVLEVPRRAGWLDEESWFRVS